ncbi:MAG: AbrB/MazE/SpoVT family DNA-binding domain-containing protein [Rhodanobacteraceae bacterium]
MTTATITSKGQITIPAAERSGMGVDTGDRVEFIEIEPGR